MSVSAESRKRVLQKAAEIGFKPNYNATTLRIPEHKTMLDLQDDERNTRKPSNTPAPVRSKKKQKRTKLIGIIASSLSLSAVNGIISEIEQVLNKRNFQIALMNTNSKKRTINYSHFKILEKWVDGGIYLPDAITQKEIYSENYVSL